MIVKDLQGSKNDFSWRIFQSKDLLPAACCDLQGYLIF